MRKATAKVVALVELGGVDGVVGDEPGLVDGLVADVGVAEAASFVSVDNFGN